MRKEDKIGGESLAIGERSGRQIGRRKEGTLREKS